MENQKTNETTASAIPAVPPPASCSAIFAESLRRMAEWYGYHPTPGAITPLDAIQAALCDVAIASEKAAEGLVWKGRNEWGAFKPNVEHTDEG